MLPLHMIKELKSNYFLITTFCNTFQTPKITTNQKAILMIYILTILNFDATLKHKAIGKPVNVQSEYRLKEIIN